MIWDATKVPTNECYGSATYQLPGWPCQRRASASIPNCIDVGIIGYYGGGLLSAATSGCLVDSTVMYSLLPLDDGGGAEYKFSAKVKSHDIFLYEMSGEL